MSEKNVCHVFLTLKLAVSKNLFWQFRITFFDSFECLKLSVKILSSKILRTFTLSFRILPVIKTHFLKSNTVSQNRKNIIKNKNAVYTGVIEIEKTISIYHNHGICISCEAKEEINIRYRLRCHEMKS